LWVELRGGVRNQPVDEKEKDLSVKKKQGGEATLMRTHHLFSEKERDEGCVKIAFHA